MNGQQYIDLYERGVITKSEFVLQCVDNLDGEEILRLPDEWRDLVLKEIDRYPADDDDEGWSGMVFLCIAVWTGTPPTQEEEREWCRGRVKLLRQELKK